MRSSEQRFGTKELQLSPLAQEWLLRLRGRDKSTPGGSELSAEADALRRLESLSEAKPQAKQEVTPDRCQVEPPSLGLETSRPTFRPNGTDVEVSTHTTLLWLQSADPASADAPLAEQAHCLLQNAPLLRNLRALPSKAKAWLLERAARGACLSDSWLASWDWQELLPPTMTAFLNSLIGFCITGRLATNVRGPVLAILTFLALVPPVVDSPPPFCGREEEPPLVSDHLIAAALVEVALTCLNCTFLTAWEEEAIRFSAASAVRLRDHLTHSGKEHLRSEMLENVAEKPNRLPPTSSDETIWHAKHYTGRGFMKFYTTGEDLGKDMRSSSTLTCRKATGCGLKLRSTWRDDTGHLLQKKGNDCWFHVQLDCSNLLLQFPLRCGYMLKEPGKMGVGSTGL
ncbi:unnamed protein product [Symbiodinium sp. KB8]|nr:unnamed protein product [Symbiodinium sp. KB8]